MVTRVFALSGVNSSIGDIFGDATKIGNLEDVGVHQANGVAMEVEHPKWPQAHRVLGFTGYRHHHEDVVKSVVAAGASEVRVAWAGEITKTTSVHRINNTSGLVHDHRVQGGKIIDGVRMSFSHDIGETALARFLPGLRGGTAEYDGRILISSLGVFLGTSSASPVGEHLDHLSNPGIFDIPSFFAADLHGLRSSGRAVQVLDVYIRLLEAAISERKSIGPSNPEIVIFAAKQKEFFKTLVLIFVDMITFGYNTPEFITALIAMQNASSRALTPQEFNNIIAALRTYQTDIEQQSNQEPQIDLVFLGAVT